MTPPPSATTASPRSSLAAMIASHTSSSFAKLLVFSPGGQDDRHRVDAGLAEVLDEAEEVLAGHVVVGDHGHPHARKTPGDLLSGAASGTRADQDVVGAFAEVDPHLAHVPATPRS